MRRSLQDLEKGEELQERKRKKDVGKFLDEQQKRDSGKYPGKQPKKGPGKYPDEQQKKNSGKYPGEQWKKDSGNYSGGQSKKNSGKYPGEQSKKTLRKYSGKQWKKDPGKYSGKKWKKDEEYTGAPAKNSVRNREFAVVTYLFLAVFLGMIAYFAYFQIEKSEAFINSPYNARQDAFADRIIRGDIVSAQGDVLATTKTAADGTETRSYPYGRMFAHAVGFSTNGKSGIESLDNFQLLRSHAFFLEKIFNEIQDKKNMGDTVVTTLDMNVQKAAYEALGSYQGAVTVIQPSTGKILAMVSKPDFDPNTISADWDSITSAEENSSVLLNRATQGLYPPGSTFKLFTLLEYMKENSDYKNYEYQCQGSLAQDENIIHCFGNSVHGQEDLRTAFAKSCNTAFAGIGLQLNLKKFAGTNEKLLFNSELPCDLPYKKSSFTLAPDAPAGEIMQTSIGQGKTLVTPYHLALVMSAVNRNGMLMKPYIVDKVTNYSGTEVWVNEPQEYAELLTAKKSQTLKQYLEAVVSDGTASALSGQSYTAAGKTGSAEFTSAKDSHAWFVGYASKEGAEDIVVSVVVEGAGTGGAYAVPIAKAVFDAYFSE